MDKILEVTAIGCKAFVKYVPKGAAALAGFTVSCMAKEYVKNTVKEIVNIKRA
jgi:hypothetical protein